MTRLAGSVGDSVSNLNCLTSDSFDGEPYSVIAHSLGGVVALRLTAGGEPVKRIFTMSSPFGGSKAATMLNMAFSLTPVFADINPLGSTIRSVRQDEITVLIRSVVTTSGAHR
jgi:alpha-beta hydrolase superfamily lysophospholipase